MSVLTEFSMFPTDKGESVSHYVSRIVKLIDEGAYSYKLTPMGTIIETDTIREALQIIEKAYNALEPDCQRIFSTVKFDIRKEAEGRLAGKVLSVEEKIGTVRK